MTGELAGLVSEAVRSIRDGRGALVMDRDGIPIEQAIRDPDVDLESVAGEYAGLLRDAANRAAAHLDEG